MATLSDELQAMCTKLEIDKPFQDWLVSEGILDVHDFALLAAHEDKVTPNIIDASRVTFAKLGDKVKVSKMWWLCRASVDKLKEIKSGRHREREDDTLDKDTEDAVKKVWNNKYGFTLSSSRLMVETLMAFRYREVHSQPPKLSILLPESIRTLSCVQRRKEQALLFQPGKSVQCEEIIADEVGDHHALFERIRADLTTICYVAADVPDFFSYQSCEHVCDSLMAFIHQKFGKTRAPVGFYHKAFVASMRVFCDAMRIERVTLQAITKDTSRWHHFWIVYNDNEKSATNGQLPDARPETSNELNRLQSMVKTMQSQKDKEIAELSGRLWKGKGKGAPKGKGKGKSYKGFDNHNVQSFGFRPQKRRRSESPPEIPRRRKY